MRRAVSIYAVPIAALAIVGLMTVGAQAKSVKDFYRGKRITLYVGYSPGGGYDRYSRTLARHMGRHIPGQPRIIVKNRPGAGSMILTNDLYNSLPADGTVMADIGRGLPQEPLFGTKEAKYDSTKFTWIGSMNNEVSICASWYKSKIKTIDDMLTKPFVVGGVGPGSDTDTFPTAINNVLGSQMRLVTGFPGGNDINFAIERGELEGRCGWSWSSVKSTRAKWLKEKKIHVLVQMSTEKHPDMPDVPFILDLAKTANQRATLAFIFARQAWGRPFLAPPNVPADRAKALQDAFMATMKDPKFLADAKKQKLEISPLSGPRVAELIKEMYATPKNIIQLATIATNEHSKIQISKAVIPIETMEGKISASKKDGRSITVTSGAGKKWKVSVSGSKTKIMIAGEKAKRKALKVGMACKLTYQGTLAKAFDCK